MTDNNPMDRFRPDPLKRIPKELAATDRPAKNTLDLIGHLAYHLPRDHPAYDPIFNLIGAEGAVLDDDMLEKVRKAWAENQPPAQDTQSKGGSRSV